MLLTKALDLTDTVTASVTSHLPGPLATPVHLAVSTLTWVPRRVVDGVEHLTDHGKAAAGKAEQAAEQAADRIADTVRETVEETADAQAGDPADQAPATDAAEEHEPEVVLTLDRPAEQVEPPIDVVGEALRAEAAEQPPAHEDEDHVEVEEEVVFSSGPDGSR